MAPREGVSPPAKQKFTPYEEDDPPLSMPMDMIDGFIFTDDDESDTGSATSYYADSFNAVYDSPLSDLDTGESGGDEEHVDLFDMMLVSVTHGVIIALQRVELRGIVMQAYQRMLEQLDVFEERAREDDPDFIISPTMTPPQDEASDEEMSFWRAKGFFYSTLADFFRLFSEDPFALPNEVLARMNSLQSPEGFIDYELD